MSITYHPATPSDAPDFARCQVEAFIEDPLHQTATGATTSAPQSVIEENIDYRTKRYALRLVKSHIHWIKAVDESTGDLAGFSGWEEPENRQPEGDDVLKALEKPSSWDVEFAGRVEERFAEMKKRVLAERKDAWCTLPQLSSQNILLTELLRCRNASSLTRLPWSRYRPGAH